MPQLLKCRPLDEKLPNLACPNMSTPARKKSLRRASKARKSFTHHSNITDPLNPQQLILTEDKVSDGAAPTNPTDAQPIPLPSQLSPNIAVDKLSQCLLGFFQKLGLLVWKNLIMRKRSCCASCMEMTFFICTFVFLMEIGAQFAPAIRRGTIPLEEFHVANETNLMRTLRGQLSSNGNFIAYAPGGEKTDEIIANVKKLLGIDERDDQVGNNSNMSANLNPQISLQPIAQSSHTERNNEPLTFFVEKIVSPLMVMQMMFMIPILVPGVIGEGATGVRELLKLNGLPGWVQWMGWMINSMIAFSIPVTFYMFALFIANKPMLKRLLGGSSEGFAIAPIVASDPTVWWTVFFLYGMAGTAFCFFISSLFSNGAMGTVVAIIFWLASYFACKETILKYFKEIPFWGKLALCLMPNDGLHLALQVMLHFEVRDGARWSNLGEPISSTDSFSVFIAMLMLIVDTLIYTFLAVYLENVWPSKYGVRKPWYYIFLWGWSFRKRSVAPAFDNGETREGFEAEPTLIPVGIEIRNLRKTFGLKKAVDGVNAKMFEGEIFALLGHNGAGKTTMISVLTGMTAPTSGTAIINSFDIRSELGRVRESLGFCPQENMLFNKLTVLEHFRFFGQLKGFTGEQAVREGNELLNTLGLTEKKNVISKDLSGGQKRKLSLGIALTGGAKVVVLDEPTSGMDPEARRALWDCLLNIRKEKTILLTTHIMEEADVLGDRIGIMADGQLQCCGTPAFLKKFYGTGYVLKVIISSKSDPNQVLSLVQSQIPDAVIKSTYAANVSEVLISLPGETTTAALATMFTQLSSKKDALGLQGIGLSHTTMDDVFVRVGELADEHKLGQTRAKVEAPPKAYDQVKSKQSESKVDGVNENRPAPDPEGGEKPVGNKLLAPKRKFSDRVSRFFQQVWALLVKKWIYTFRNYGLLFIQLPLPVIITILIVILRNTKYKPDPIPPPSKISLDSYQEPVALYSSQEAPDKSIIKKILNWKSDSRSLNERHIIRIEVRPNATKAMFHHIPYHSTLLAINVMTNYLLEKAKPGANHRIQLINHPLIPKGRDSFQLPSNPTSDGEGLARAIMVLIMIALIMCTSTFTIFPTEERVSKAKQLQIMTGLSPITYWTICFLYDYLTILITISLMVASFSLIESFKVYSSPEGLKVLFLILAIYSFSALSLAYLISFQAETSTGGFAFLVIIQIVTGILLSYISIYIPEGPEVNAQGVLIKFFLRWFGRFLCPAYSAAIAIHRFATVAAYNGKCALLSEEVSKIVCQTNAYKYEEYLSCCKEDCYTPEAYLEWSYPIREENGIYSQLELGDNCKQKIPFFVPGISQELFWAGLLGFIYLLTILLVEHWQDISGLVMKSGKENAWWDVKIIPHIKDEDVLEESQRVSGMVNSRDLQDALVVEILAKNYGSFAAVDGVSFGVHHGECFGLLGVNGAGKTTTFRMLTGDEWRSSGNAYAFGNTLDMNRSKFFANIGYCPQFDGIIGVLSGRQMLQLFARLRGVPWKIVGVEVDKWLKKVGLSDSGKVQCRKYSGGMKRRLSAAMAMIGDPPLLLLDEPTSGVDPVSRRRFWVVLESVKQSGQSIILTSHSMEECEALCSRLAIMVNGQLQGFGGVQHLKAKYGQANKLSVTVSKAVEPELMQRVEDLSNEIIATFEPCVLKDKHQGVMVYDIQNVAIPYSTIFQSMEDMKKRYEGILQEYTVSETSLEDVFLSFARAQYGERKVDPSTCERIFYCRC